MRLDDGMSRWFIVMLMTFGEVLGVMGIATFAMYMWFKIRRKR